MSIKYTAQDWIFSASGTQVWVSFPYSLSLHEDRGSERMPGADKATVLHGMLLKRECCLHFPYFLHPFFLHGLQRGFSLEPNHTRHKD